MSDSKTYSSNDFLPMVIEVAKMGEKQANLLTIVQNVREEQREQAGRIKNIESKVMYAAGVISLLSAAMAIIVNLIIRKTFG